MMVNIRFLEDLLGKHWSTNSSDFFKSATGIIVLDKSVF